MTSRGPQPKRTGSTTARMKGRFLLWLSGADLGALEQVPDETKKFTGVGGVVVTTSVMATVSCMFALASGARAPLYIAVPAGILWGLAIMNLDRWLVTATVRRQGWRQNFVIALPRLVLALIIGAVISTPLVLWIFQREIKAELDVIHQQKRTTFEAKLRKEGDDKGIPQLRKDIERLQAVVDGTATGLVPPSSQIGALQTEVDKLNDDYQTKLADAECELDGRCGSMHKGDGPSYRFKLAVANQAKAKLNEASGRLAAAKAAAAGDEKTAIANVKASAAVTLEADKAEVDAFDALQKAERDQFNVDNANDSGLLARLEALSSLTNRNVTLKTAYIALLLFITAIEVLPVVVKFLMSLGEPTLYDDIVREAAATRIDTAKARFAYEKELAQRELDERLAREQSMVTELVDRMVKAEADVYDDQIRRWKDTELGRTSAAPGPAPRNGTRPAQPRGGRAPDQHRWPTPGQRRSRDDED